MILGQDPLYAGDIWDALPVTLLKAVAAFVFLLVSVMLNIWFLRKVISDFQNRIGPNIAGPWGILQTLADGIKLFFKEDLIPDNADRFTFKLAPYLSLVPAFLTFAIVPVGGDFNGDGSRDGLVTILGKPTFLQVADPPIGILFFLAMSSLAIYGVMLAGWSSGSKYPLLGSVRASAQMVSYEAALGLAVAAVVLQSGSLSTHDMVLSQSGGLANWAIVTTGVVPFVVFFIAGTAELNHPPFDLVEAEQELVGGFHTEYSSIRFALFFLAEFMNQITISAIVVTMFLGGPHGPSLFLPDGWWVGTIWFFLKLSFFLFAFVWIRATLPRFRYDQLMDLGWKFLIPLSLFWLILLAGLRIGDGNDWGLGNYAAWFIGWFAGVALLSGLLAMAMNTARSERLAEAAEKEASRG
ncbi:MAG: NADH-quinone oxidoreductase subunit NuoH [Acidimicrobiales bacterium]|nr:NADH-quinone oxidoreductase subunit NuoH [Acidimicrobiales bacterium]MDG1875891.1 NADH-quinone oxidoreductase subunit NuoH [Acidimicrobiales bacterium]